VSVVSETLDRAVETMQRASKVIIDLRADNARLQAERDLLSQTIEGVVLEREQAWKLVRDQQAQLHRYEAVVGAGRTVDAHFWANYGGTAHDPDVLIMAKFGEMATLHFALAALEVGE
jgi:hypothetical protein